jgi:hypothetical protein
VNLLPSTLIEALAAGWTPDSCRADRDAGLYGQDIFGRVALNCASWSIPGILSSHLSFCPELITNSGSSK